MRKINILVVDDEKDILRSLARILSQEGYNSYTALSAEEALEIINIQPIDIILSDIVMPGMTGLELLKKVKAEYSYIHVVMLTAYGTIESSIEAIKSGAFGYLLKPFNVEEIFNEIKKIERLIVLEEQNKAYKQKEASEFYIFDSKNPEMKKILHTIQSKIAPSESTVLITGESGTGKEIIANYIHSLSNRQKGPFVKVSCAALSEGVLESELFGHMKGSFTGAIKDKVGRFEAASSGTIFLDEIGDFSANIQLKMLRVLQEKTIAKVGSNEEIKVNTRVIAATNKNLETEVKDGNFREDLWYRINVISIELPPLKNRKEDILPLIENFIKKYSIKNSVKISHIEDNALDALIFYDWPGNIRELENTIERAIVLSENGIIRTENLPDKVKPTDKKSIFQPSTLKEARESFEKEFITKSLKNNNNNITQTAKELGLARKNLYEKIKKLNIVY